MNLLEKLYIATETTPEYFALAFGILSITSILVACTPTRYSQKKIENSEVHIHDSVIFGMSSEWLEKNKNH